MRTPVLSPLTRRIYKNKRAEQVKFNHVFPCQKLEFNQSPATKRPPKQHVYMLWFTKNTPQALKQAIFDNKARISILNIR